MSPELHPSVDAEPDPISPFDLQVNGYAGVDFNADDLLLDDVVRTCEQLRADGVGRVLATVITAEMSLMCRRLARLAAWRNESAAVRDVIAGVHVEGPFLSAAPGYHGAHDPSVMRDANRDDASRLLDAAGGDCRLLTLAPERDPNAVVTGWLVEQGVRVSAGHTNADWPTLQRAVDAGLSMVTHVGNGCPAELPRHDNIIQRALALRDRVWLCFIADGVHIPPFVLRNYLALAGASRAIIVTDAMALAGRGPGSATLGQWRVKVGSDLAVRSHDGSHLVGSAVTMRQAIDNLTAWGLPPDTITRMTAINPRRAIGFTAPLIEPAENDPIQHPETDP